MPSRARAPRSSDAYIWDLCALLTGFIGATALAAEVDTMNFVWVWFMPVIGLSASTAALVGNAIGAGHPQHARRVLWTCVLLDCAVWATTAAIVYAARWPIAALLTSDPRIQALIAPCLAIYCLAGFADSAQNVMAGGLRGLGKQDFGAGVILGCFWLVLLPLAALLVFAIPPPDGLDEHRLFGVWYSFFTGTSLAAAIFCLYIRRLDFGAVAEALQEDTPDEATAEYVAMRG